MRVHRACTGLAIASVFVTACTWDWGRFDGLDAGNVDAAFDAIDTDASACGTVGAACCARDGTPMCVAGLSCVQSRCAACPSGHVVCGNGCVDLSSDVANCGSCGHACGASSHCVSGVCAGVPPSNDARIDATPIDTMSSSATLHVDTTFARNDTTGPCACTSGHDAFYRFELSDEEIVYADTVGSTFDTSLFLQDSNGNDITDARLAGGATCSNDGALGCSIGTQSMLAARLAAGTYYLVVSGCGAGAVTLHFQHLPVGGGSVTHVATMTGTTQSFADSTSGVGTVTASCCSDGPENTYWFVTCPTFAAITLHASTCGNAAFDTELDQRSASRFPVSQCNDNACGAQSQLDAMLPAGAGLHTLYVDSCASSGGAYTLLLTLGDCGAGTLCDGRCTSLQTDPDHCGSCGTVCPDPPAGAARTCTAGVCGIACLPGFGDCNGDPSDGCETALDAVDHCGSCSTVCSTLNASAGCPSGTCTLTCNGGFGDCDGNVSNGCETNLQTDRSNCGACNRRCVGARVCSAGVCV